MAKIERLICGDCKGTSEFRKGKRGSFIVETLLWSVFFIPGLLYSIWRRTKRKKTCQYCGSSFLMPKDSPFARDLLYPNNSNDSNNSNNFNNINNF